MIIANITITIRIVAPHLLHHTNRGRPGRSRELDALLPSHLLQRRLHPASGAVAHLNALLELEGPAQGVVALAAGAVVAPDSQHARHGALELKGVRVPKELFLGMPQGLSPLFPCPFTSNRSKYIHRYNYIMLLTPLSYMFVYSYILYIYIHKKAWARRLTYSTGRC